MNVDPMMFKVLGIPNAMIGKSTFPDFQRIPELLFNGMRVSALDELHRTFQRDSGGRDQQMEMFRHEHKGVNLKFSLPPVGVERLQEKTSHRLSDKQTAPLPCS